MKFITPNTPAFPARFSISGNASLPAPRRDQLAAVRFLSPPSYLLRVSKSLFLKTSWPLSFSSVSTAFYLPSHPSHNYSFWTSSVSTLALQIHFLHCRPRDLSKSQIDQTLLSLNSTAVPRSLPYGVKALQRSVKYFSTIPAPVSPPSSRLFHGTQLMKAS